MRPFAVLSVILLFLAASSFAALDFNPRRHLPQAHFLDTQAVIKPSTRPLSAPSPDPTIKPASNPEQAGLAAATTAAAADRPVATAAIIVGLAGLLFAMGMGV
ncbi:hypothetical protein BDV96DRAFT_206555 [Lophiotrema nucula]|uniref:Uncharacterized protein n=1 Tax=Lophiotrema nucula TaxID=690887 RepID=A0A6A5ZSG5_9PLEO|nr:hypothetical protein BDV96DRAFT_206555 [Lophiotrema nucula]